MDTPRKLAAILAADIAGYSRLMGLDEAGTAKGLREHRAAIDPILTGHGGRIFKTMGDGVLVEFPSIVAAVESALAVQKLMAERNADVPEDRRMLFRIGINLGDVLIEGDDVLGDGVNVAARLEGLAEPGGICISDDSYRQVRGKLDVAFEDAGEQQLKNIMRPVGVYRIRFDGAAKSTPTLPLPEKPSIAVLPFQNMSGDPEQEYFADGMVEEITTAIARLPWLFVIARNSAFTYKGKAFDLKQVARELGVRYVLEGSVRKAGNRVRITGQLIDTATGAHIWADRFDGALDDIFGLQDQVASSVVGAIEPQLRKSEIERAARKPTENLEAYDLYLRAAAAMYKDLVSPEAIEFARKALAVQPDYAPAAAVIAMVLCNRSITLGRSLTDTDLAEALDLARHAIETSRDDPDTLARGGCVLAYLSGEHAAGMRAIERALALNPSCAYAWSVAARVHILANRPDAAIAAAERAIRLSPLDPLSVTNEWALGSALMLAGRYEEAMEWTDRCLHDRPSFQAGIRTRVALCGYLGRAEEAREWVKRSLDVNPAMTIAGYTAYASRFFSADALAVWVEGFRRAGLPEA